jgi:hypothetical protein
MSNNLHVIIILPRWAMHLTKHTREVHRAFMGLNVCSSKSSQLHMCHLCPCVEQKYMLEMVGACRNAGKIEEHYDLFSGLLDVALDELDDQAAITAEEIIGKCNVY